MYGKQFKFVKRKRQRPKKRVIRVDTMKSHIVDVSKQALRTRLGIPYSRVVKLKYCDWITIDSPITIASHYFRANSLFDPDRTGAGHQPLYFDQVIVPYDHYTVTHSKIVVTYINGTADRLIPGVFGIFLDDNSTISYTTVPAILEGGQKYSSNWKTTGGAEDYNRPKKCSLSFNASRFFNTKNTVGKEGYKAAFSGNPTETADYCVWVGSVNGNNPTSVNLLVEIEMTATLTEKSFTAQS